MQTKYTGGTVLHIFLGEQVSDTTSIKGLIRKVADNYRLPQGAGGTVAVYTKRGKPLHIISKVVMRMQAWLGYLTSP